MAKDAPGQGIRATAIDPLQPLIFAARGLAVLVLVLLVLGTLATVFGSGSVLTIGEDATCIAVNGGREVPIEDTAVATGPRSQALAPGVTSINNQYQLCQDRPGASAQVLSVLTVAPAMLLLLGFLTGVFLLVRRARGSGLFSRPFSQAVHWLGWYVLAGALLVSIVQALASSALLQHMMPGHAVLDINDYWQVSISTLLAGAGLLTIARVLRLTVAMREDLDATI